MSRRTRRDGGFTLMEVVVSLTLLAVVLMSLAGLMFKAARRAVNVSNLTTMGQAITQQVNRVSVLPYDSMAVGTTCKAVSASGFGYTRCVRVDQLQPKVKQITLTITPANAAIKPDTEVFRRTKPATANPLNH